MSIQEDEPLFKVCPFSMAREKQIRCIEHECAWWDDYGAGHCAFKGFVKSVGYIGSLLKEKR